MVVKEKSKAASDVLKLMDMDYSYTQALEIVLGTFISKAKLEKELEKYI